MSEKSVSIEREDVETGNVHILVTNKERSRLFKVAVSSVNDSANGVWAEIYSEFKGISTPGNAIVPEAVKNGFTPSCGWPEFMEKLWLLKHYIDQTGRLCGE